jgi:hypothetical protein
MKQRSGKTILVPYSDLGGQKAPDPVSGRLLPAANEKKTLMTVDQ